MSRWWWSLLFVGGCTTSTNLLSTHDSSSCSGLGAPLMFQTGASTSDTGTCAGALASQSLRYALCSCSALLLERGLFTQGGSGGPPMRGPDPAPPAAVGTDDYFQMAGLGQVGGVLAIGGSDGAGFARTAGILGNFRSAGSVRSDQILSVGGDAHIDGDVLGKVDIAGTLYVPSGTDVEPSVQANDVVNEQVIIPPPCGCASTSFLDISKLVSERSAVNDNLTIGLKPTLFEGGDGPDQYDLPCGQFYLKDLSTTDGAELELRIHGHTGLFIGGDVALDNGLRVTLDDGAELDLVVGGNFSVDSGNVGADTTEAVRLWLGSATVQVGDNSSLSAAVYAPYATVIGNGDLFIRGAILAGALSVAGDISIQFDDDILSDGVSCGAPVQSIIQ